MKGILILASSNSAVPAVSPVPTVSLPDTLTDIPAASSRTYAILEQALAGRKLEYQDGVALIEAPDEDVPAIMAAAAFLRDKHKGRVITYSRKVFIPLTNLCRDKCGYCTFAKAPRDPAAKTLTPDEVLAIARAGKALGCKEALFSLGERPEEMHQLARDHLRKLGYPSTIAYLKDMCELVLKETGLLPHANPGIMTPEELDSLWEVNASMGIMLESTSERLMEKGQAHYGCPGKAPGLRLQTMRDAGDRKIAFTTGILIGIGETRAERVDSLLAIRDVYESHGNIQEVIIQNFRVKPDIRFRHRDEPTLDDMLRTLSVGRLLLGGEMNLQAPPNLTPDDYGTYLGAGINDYGGISPVTRDHINPERAWPLIDELSETCTQRGFVLRERMALYPEYLKPELGYVRAGIAPIIENLADAQGLVSEKATWHKF
jgi:7,8-didemethyl-8-hydroxy-5-deazariboflavin synthase CofG subunit